MSTPTFQAWLAELAASPHLTPKGRSVLGVLRTQPRASAFGSTRELAGLAGVNVGTITRTAQSLGYAGWPELQREFRSRYISGLSATEVASAHAEGGSSAAASLGKDRDDLGYLAQAADSQEIRAVAGAIAGAGRTLVLAQGSYAAVGTALAHNAGLAGYEARQFADPALAANALSAHGAGDLLLAINLWRPYRATVELLRSARRAGVATVVVCDAAVALPATLADHRLVVPSEGVGFFPSLVGALAVCQAVVVELARVDPERSRAAVGRAERAWQTMALFADER